MSLDGDGGGGGSGSSGEDVSSGPSSLPSVGRSSEQFIKEDPSVKVAASKEIEAALSTIAKRRDLNRVNARKSRIRKSFAMQNLKNRLQALVEENKGLRQSVVKHLDCTLEDVVGPTPLPVTNALPSSKTLLGAEAGSRSKKPRGWDVRRSHLSEVDRLARKRDLNRVNARKSRIRKKAYIHSLRTRIDLFSEENKKLIEALETSGKPILQGVETKRRKVDAVELELKKKMDAKLACASAKVSHSPRKSPRAQQVAASTSMPKREESPVDNCGDSSGRQSPKSNTSSTDDGSSGSSKGSQNERQLMEKDEENPDDSSGRQSPKSNTSSTDGSSSGSSNQCKSKVPATAGSLKIEAPARIMAADVLCKLRRGFS